MSARTLRLAVEPGEIEALHPLDAGPWVLNRETLQTAAAATLSERVTGRNRQPAVGVNIGQTLLKVKSLHPERLYYGFEPNSSCYHYVQHLVTLNDLRSCHVLPIALWNETRLLTLHLDSPMMLAQRSSTSFVSGTPA